VSDIDFSLLDVPRDAPPADLEAYLRTAIAWHFGAATGSPFWLRAGQALDFDPLTDVQTFRDLRRFPGLVDELRSVPVEDLIPRGYGSPPPIPRVFESGGTTGAPKLNHPLYQGYSSTGRSTRSAGFDPYQPWSVSQR
jgi:hypothetical protein